MRAVRTVRVASRLPEALAPLHELAMNLGWLADGRVQDLFRRVSPEIWDDDGVDALGFLASVPQARLDMLAADEAFVAGAAALLDDLRRSLTAPRWHALRKGPLRQVAYFSPEFGIAESLPQYAGGLGILAGDHLKAAADLGVPLVGVGLFYAHGYFNQDLDASGMQQERFPRLHPQRMALTQVEGVDVTLLLAGRDVMARVWSADVGIVRLLLLDTDCPENHPDDRAITDRLYGGGPEQRLRQELVLGIGGLRALAACGIEPDVFHLNEGHAGFLALERLRIAMEQHGLTLDEAIAATRSATVFTTHTPVPAGIDRFPRDLVERYLGGWVRDCGLGLDDLMALGQEPGAPAGETFNLACFSLRVAGAANGVSELHGGVSREMFAGIWPGLRPEDVPITHVTNGVHGRTWVSRELSDLLARHIGPDWPYAGPRRWDSLEQVPDEELWAVRSGGRERLVHYARERLREGLRSRGAAGGELAWIDDVLHPGALTIGFARRFAPYKRATLLMRDPERLRRLLLDDARPVQLIFAGKAHPADEPGKRLLQQVVHASGDPDLRARLVFLEDFGIEVGRALYRGCDVWLNTPRRPLEACGTSGMKAVLNGGLHCSTLDGWWAESFSPAIGWAIPSAEWMAEEDERDAAEAEALYRLLEREMVPEFYDRDPVGVPRRWLRRVRESLRTLGPRVAAGRMVTEYVERLYEPAATRAAALSADGARRARDLVAWRDHVEAAWSGVSVVNVSGDEGEAALGDPIDVEAQVALGALHPGDVAVQMLHGSIHDDDDLEGATMTPMTADAEPVADGVWRYRAAVTPAAPGGFGYTVRVMPSHPDLGDASEIGLSAWPAP